MSSRVIKLVENIRQCKTQAEEREVVQKELAETRQILHTLSGGSSANGALSGEGTTNVARAMVKCLLVSMLGYNTAFARMDCFKLIAQPNFQLKHIGYLVMMSLVDETHEVLMLSTNTIQNDLRCGNKYVIGLALTAVGNIGSPAMMRDLGADIAALMGSEIIYVRKKAALCAARCVTKVPEIADTFYVHAKTYLSSRSHGALIAGMTILHAIASLNSAYRNRLRKYIPNVLRILKNISSPSVHAPEHRMGGIVDPFLHVACLQLLRLLDHVPGEHSEQVCTQLASLCNNIPENHIANYAVKYEVVRTILDRPRPQHIREIAATTLEKFMDSPMINLRYVALKTLVEIAPTDPDVVMRQPATVYGCLHSPDSSIRRLALTLTYSLVTADKVQEIAEELVLYAHKVAQNEMADICIKTCSISDRFCPTSAWHVDLMLRLFMVKHMVPPPAVVEHVIHFISLKEEVQVFAVWQAAVLMQQNCTCDAQGKIRSWIGPDAVAHVGAWAIGELADVLFSEPCPDFAALLGRQPSVVVVDSLPVGTTGQEFTNVDILVDVLEAIFVSEVCTMNTKAVAIMAVAKLASRASSVVARVSQLLKERVGRSLELDLQSRGVELSMLISLAEQETIFEPVPAIDEKRFEAHRVAILTAAGILRSVKRPSGEGAGAIALKGVASGASTKTANTDGSESSLIGTSGASGAAAVSAPPSGGAVDLLGGGGGGDVTTGAAPAQPQDPLADLLGANSAQAVPTASVPSATAGLDFLAQAAPSIPAATPSGGAQDPLADLLGGVSVAPTPAGVVHGVTDGLSAISLLNTISTAAPAPMGAVANFNVSAGGAGFGAFNAGMVANTPLCGYDKNGMSIAMQLTKPAPANLSATQLTATYSNKGLSPIEHLTVEWTGAEPHILVKMLPASGVGLGPSGTTVIQQVVQIINQEQGKKPIALRINVSLRRMGQTLTETALVQNIPQDY